jgi:hypothetical protein
MSKKLALIALAAVGVVAAWSIHSSTGRESGAGKTTAIPSAAGGHRLVLLWVRTGEKTRIRKTCGLIHLRGKPLAVDIDEGRLPLTCFAARAVMTRYLAIARVHRWSSGAGSYRHPIYRSLPFSCYKSRPDGVGWDYHCNYSKYSSADAYVDVGAGRRPYR